MNKDIRIYDFEFNLVYIISDWISVNWEIHYNKAGTFELHIPFHSGLVRVLEDNLYLVAVQGDKQAIITGRQFTDEIAIYGRTVNWLLSKRVVLPFAITKETDCETLIRTKLGEVFDTNDNLILLEATGGFDVITEYELKKPKDALVFTSDLLSGEGAGHRLTFVPRKHKWEFEIYRGSEKPYILSPDNNNAYDPCLNQDILDMCNGVYYKETNAENYTLIPSEKSGIYRWYAVSNSASYEDAMTHLQQKGENRKLTLNATDLTYGRDYGLGDIISVETSFGGEKIRQKRTVTGVSIWDEALSHGESPIFE